MKNSQFSWSKNHCRRVAQKVFWIGTILAISLSSFSGCTAIENAESYLYNSSALSEHSEPNRTTTSSESSAPVQSIAPTQSSTPAQSSTPTETLTAGQKNALRSAASYLSYSAFSHDGLIDQLEFEKFTAEEANYAANHCGADWKEQALKSAKSYLEYTAFSHDGLIDQLEFEKFTAEEAKYAADNCGADWKEQAVRCAESYLDFSSFSKEGVVL